jgi:phosphate transport system substrate-binding protein
LPRLAWHRARRKGETDVRSPSARAATVSLLTAFTLLLMPAVAGARALLLSGSTSMYPLVTQLAALYHKDTHQPEPRVGQGTSGAGIDEVNAGRVDIADVSRDPIESDPHGLEFTKIARDALCVITNSSNHLSNLSTQQVEQIFTGQIRSWSEIQGATATGPIDLYDRVASSGTQDAFEDIFLGETLKIAPSASQLETEGGMRQAIIGDKNGIGFASFDFIKGTNAVSYGGIPCTLRNAKSGQYEGVRNFWMVTKGPPKGAAKKFIDWITNRHNTAVERIVATEWIPVY